MSFFIGVSLNPVPSSVLAPKGEKNVYKIVNNNEKKNLTVLVTANAEGTLAPTLILFSGKTLPNNCAQFAPDDIVFGVSDNGWMLAKNYFEYVANIFEPWLTQNKIDRPVILYIDGHSSHLTLHLSQFCSTYGINLVALHPNATHIIQPLDVGFFKPFKTCWQRMTEKFCTETSCIGLQKCQVSPLLKKTFDSMDLKNILSNGFKKCGLLPFDIDAIDFSKVVRKFEKNDESVEINTEDFLQNKNKLKLFESFLTIKQIQAFKQNQSSIWNGPKEDESLFKIWFQLANLKVDEIPNQVKFLFNHTNY